MGVSADGRILNSPADVVFSVCYAGNCAEQAGRPVSEILAAMEQEVKRLKATLAGSPALRARSVPAAQEDNDFLREPRRSPLPW